MFRLHNSFNQFLLRESIESLQKKLTLLLRAGERGSSPPAPISLTPQKCLLISFERFRVIF